MKCYEIITKLLAIVNTFYLYITVVHTQLIIDCFGVGAMQFPTYIHRHQIYYYLGFKYVAILFKI